MPGGAGDRHIGAGCCRSPFDGTTARARDHTVGVRLIGYLNRRPYLWLADLDNRTVEPAAELRRIPQGIDELIPFSGGVAVRCGPHSFVLESDLSGQGRPLLPEEAEEVGRRALNYDWPELPSHRDRVARVTDCDGHQHLIEHPAVDHWGFGATWSPDRRWLALDGCTVPPPPPRPLFPLGEMEPEPHVLVLFDRTDQTVRICEGTFDQSGHPMWATDGTTVVVGAAFEPKRLYVALLDELMLHPVAFKRHAPTPLVDTVVLPALQSG